MEEDREHNIEGLGQPSRDEDTSLHQMRRTEPRESVLYRRGVEFLSFVEVLGPDVEELENTDELLGGKRAVPSLDLTQAALRNSKLEGEPRLRCTPLRAQLTDQAADACGVGFLQCVSTGPGEVHGVRLRLHQEGLKLGSEQ